MRHRSFVVVVVGICSAPFLALACGDGDDTNANVPPQNSCAGNLGSSILVCPDASTDAPSLSDRSIRDATPDVVGDAGYYPLPPHPPPCTGAVAIDTTFGNSGFVINTTAGADFAGIAVQPDGKYVVVTTDGPDPSPLARRLVNGSIDTTFGTNGFAVGAQASSQILIEPSGRLILAATDGTHPGLVALTPAGTLDTTFGVSGFGPTTYLDPVGIPTGLSYFGQKPNGKFVAVAAVYVNVGPHPPTRNDIALVQFDVNGIADSTFGNHGIAYAGYVNNANPTALLIEPDGKILVGGYELNPIDDAGNGHQDFVVLRFNEDGSLDNTFGSGGKILVPLGSRFVGAIPASMAYQSSGNVVIAVSSFGGNVDGGASNNVFQLLRIKPNGDIDTSFGGVGTGFATATFLHGYEGDTASSVNLYSDDSIIAGGSIATADDAGEPDTTLGFARFTADGIVDTTFGDNGILVVNPPGITEGSNLAVQILQSNGQIFASAIGENPDPDDDLDDYGILFRLTCPR